MKVFCHLSGNNGRFIEIGKRGRKTVISLVEYGQKVRPVQIALGILKTKQHRMCLEVDKDLVSSIIRALQLSIKSHGDCHDP